jgi:hypothetical protein
MYLELFKKLAEGRPEHNLFSPSGSKRWTQCHGWYEATKDLPYKPSGLAAQRGTEAHDLFDQCMKANEFPENFSNNTDLIEIVGYVLDYVNSYKSLYPEAKIFSEVYFPNDNLINPGINTGGTIDLLGIIPKKQLLIGDLKTGNYIVDVEGNTQLLSYALAARKHLGAFDNYKLVIIQPGPYHCNGPIRELNVSNLELNEFEAKVNFSITANLNNGDRLPGDHCKYCKAEATCKEKAVYVLNQVGLSLNDFLEG